MPQQKVGRNDSVRRSLEAALDNATDKDLVEAVADALRVRVGGLLRSGMGPASFEEKQMLAWLQAKVVP